MEDFSQYFPKEDGGDQKPLTDPSTPQGVNQEETFRPPEKKEDFAQYFPTETQEREEVKKNLTIRQGVKKNITNVSEVKALSDEFLAPVELVEKKLDFYREASNYNKIRSTLSFNKELRDWTNSPDRVAMLRDSPDVLEKIAVKSKRFHLADTYGEPSYFEMLGRNISGNALQIEQGARLYAAIQGNDVDGNLERIAEITQKMQAQANDVPDYIKEYEKELGPVTESFNKEYIEAVSAFKEIGEDLSFKALFKANVETYEAVAELFSYLGNEVMHPRAASLKMSQSALNTILPLVAGLPAAKGGALVGGGLGSVVPGVGTGLGALIGGTAAGFTAMTGTGTVLEYTSEISSELGSRVDMSDPEAIRAALQDKKFIENSKSRAARKAITTASFESVITLLGSPIFKSAVRGAKVGKATIGSTIKNIAKEQATEGFSEAGGEFAGQAARELDIEKVNISEVVFEGLSGVFMGAGLGGVFYTAKSAKDLVVGGAAKATQRVKQIAEKSSEAQSFANNVETLAEDLQAINESDIDPAAAAELIEKASGGNSQIYMQADEFNEHWENQGEDAVSKADDLLPGGRKDLQEARDNGGFIRIPLSDYLTKFKDEESFLAINKLVRKAPDALSAAQAETIGSNIPQMLKQIAKDVRAERKKLVSSRTTRQAIEVEVEGQFLQAGLDAKTAKSYGQLYTANIEALATIIGEDPNKFLDRRRLEVRGLTTEEATAILNDRARVEPTIERVTDLETGEVTEVEAETTEDPDGVLFQEGDELPKGFIDLSDPDKMIISILSDANQSTGLHEMGHAFLENMKLAKSLLENRGIEGLNAEQLRLLNEDIPTILEELGVNSLDDITTAEHEKFARLTEAYLMEGNAPTKRLRQAFNRFRTWLISIYKNLKGIERAGGVKLNISDELRETFNRMFATQEELNDIQEDNGTSPDILEEMMEQMRFDDKDKERVKQAWQEARFTAEDILLKKNIAEITRKKGKKYKDRAKTLRDDVTKEAEGRQVYKSVDAIKAGEINGEPLAKGETLKMNPELIKEYVDINKLPKSIYTDKGADPKIVADLLGYDSVQAMLDEMATMPNKQGYIDTKVKMLLNQEFPDMLDIMNPDRIYNEAIAALDNTPKDKALALEFDILLKQSPAEAKKLIKRLFKQLPSNKEFTAQAQLDLDKTLVKDLKPYQFRILERRNRREAGQTAIKGDFETALNAKIAERYNYHLAKESDKLKLQIEKDFRNLRKKYQRKDADLKKKGNLDMLKVAQTILSRHNILTEGKIKDTKMYLEKMEKYAPETYEKTAALVESLGDLGTKDYKELTVEEFQSVVDTAEAIYNLGVQEEQITVGGQTYKKEVVLKKMIEALGNVDDKTIRRIAAQAKGDESVIKVKGMRKLIKDKIHGLSMFALSTQAGMTRVSHLAYYLDGGQDNGPWQNFFWEVANEAQENYDSTLVTQQEKLNDVFKEYFAGILSDPDEINLRKYFKGLNPQHSTMTKSQLAMALIHSGNESNLKKLIIGNEWGQLDAENKLDSKAYTAFLKDMEAQGIIDKNMMDGVQAIWDMFEDYKPEIQRAHKEVYGTFFKEIEATPLSFEFGEYRGGYAPAVTDPLRVSDQDMRQLKEATGIDSNMYTLHQTPSGFRKERSEAYAQPLSLDFAMLRSHVEKTVRFATIQPALGNVNKLLQSKELQGAINDKNRFWYKEVLVPFATSFADQSTASTRPASTAGQKAVKAMRKYSANISAAYLSGNITNVVEQVLEATALREVTSLNKVRKNIARITMDNKKYSEELKKLSPVLDRRLQEYIFDVNRTYNDMNLYTGLSKAKAKAEKFGSDHAFILQRAVDGIMLPAGFFAIYDDKMSEGLSSEESAKAAERAVLRIFGGSRVIDRSAVEKSSDFVKLFIPFYSYFNNKWNAGKFSSTNGKSKVTSVFNLWILPGVLSMALRKAVRGTEEDEPWYQTTAEVALLGPLNMVAAMYPGGGSIFRLIQGQFTAPFYDDRLSPALIMGVTEQTFKVVKNVGKAAFTDEDLKGKDVRDMLTLFNVLSGVPTGAIARPSMYIFDLAKGDEKADNVMDFTKGIMTGRSGR